MKKTIINNFNNLKQKKDIIVLSFESSCDETSVAIVKNGREILSNIISTQIPIHERFGGVVPEVASRNHITAISNITRECLAKASMTFANIDAIAVTYGAGLIGALLVGVNFAKSLAYALDKPLIGVSHIQGHIAANYLSSKTLQPPFICLLVSGGHTAILHITDYNKHELIGTTIDDAVGEAFDKVARVVGLGYPGGPKVDKLAKEGNASINFINHSNMANSYNFSFSGLKTAVINYVHNAEQKGETINKADICASFQERATDELVNKTIKACKDKNLNTLVIAGGVSANSKLREKMKLQAEKENINVFYPELILCTDNAAMIGASAYYMIKAGEGLADYDLTAKANINL